MRSKLVIAILLLLSSSTAADEGMWTLGNFPREAVRQKYGVDVTEPWLNQLRLATTRLEGGCTGSFASPDGLVLTNHHCVRRCVSQISSAENDVAANGFLATGRGQEVRCEAQSLSVLSESVEITSLVAEATADKTDLEAKDVRQQTLSRLEKECEEESDGRLVCEAVTLYRGGQYFIYKYKRYDDVRLVFVPESAIAAFGGDPDNFNFPRWCLDMAFLRAYENGAPARTPNYLRWRPDGAEADEPVFVTGHPGSTDRLMTVAELKYTRDVVLPHWLMRYGELRGRLIQFAKTGNEAHRITQTPLLSYENAIKVRRNHLRALLDDSLIARKQTQEHQLREAVAADAEMRQAYGSAWDEIAEALTRYQTFREDHLFIEEQVGFNSGLFGYARTLVRAAAERQKPNEDRFREYRDTALPRMKQVTLAARPIYPALEELTLSFSLDKLREFLGPDSRHVKDVLGSKSPDALAAQLVLGSRLGDANVREALWKGSQQAIDVSDDPMIELALQLEPEARALRKRYEEEVEAPIELASEKIAAARFAIQGTSRYPDATFTLRVTYGSVQGWVEQGEPVAPFTTLRRAFGRATGKEPFRIPDSWIAVQDQLDMDTRFNLVTTTDITGGNSGSPLIDRDGNLVGLVFDGNIHSIAGDYWFDEAKNRTVAVHPAVMLAVLEVVYGADQLLFELDQH